MTTPPASTSDGATHDRPLAIGVLGSGKGSNLEAIFDAIAAGRLRARVVCVIADVALAYILERARAHGVPAFFLDAGPSKTRLDGDGERRYIETLRRHGAEVVALAGFMRIVKPALLAAYAGRIVNIHPSLLPAFPGLEAWKQALRSGAKTSGCTVHLVDSGTDTGPVLVQKTVPVLEGDTPETLHARIQVQEYIAYPEALNLLARRLRGA